MRNCMITAALAIMLLGCCSDDEYNVKAVSIPPIDLGVLLNAMAGSEVGEALVKEDQPYAEGAAQKSYTVALGQPVLWYNPDSGHYGTVTTTREGRDTATGWYCRDFRQNVVVGGKSQNTFGKACRQPNGKWLIMSQDGHV